jgi:hypothetical protein
MATYTELIDIANTAVGDSLRQKIRVAVVVAADVIRQEASTVPNNANRLVWAKVAITNPDQEARKMLWAVLAQNRTFTVTQITGAGDTEVQTAVNAAVNLLAQ